MGITALGAGVIGVTALGLLGLAARVTFGVATGELDPNKKKAAPSPAEQSPVPLDAQGLPKVTGAWYDVPKMDRLVQTRAEAQERQQQQEEEGQQK